MAKEGKLNMKDPLLTFDQAGEYLNQIAAQLPIEIMRELNGGIVLVPDRVDSPHGNNLYILGTYHYEPYGLGRYILLNYGSFAQVYRGCPLAEQQKGLKEVLHHELTHHLESLAGVRDLEVEDERFIEKYGNQNK